MTKVFTGKTVWRIGLALFSLAIAGCYSASDAAPDRSIVVEDLLLTSDALPDFEYAGPIRDTHHSCQYQCHRITFETVSEGLRIVISEDLHYHGRLSAAETTFQNPALASGMIPAEFELPDTQADEQKVLCSSSKLPRSDALGCAWVGRYDEFVVKLEVMILPTAFDWEDFRRLIERADLQVIRVLDSNANEHQPTSER